uniref:Uncharacterized protein n=1 Tax=Ciona intestinalis TaxID=7719 RepID=H2XME5_CIOIN
MRWGRSLRGRLALWKINLNYNKWGEKQIL